MIFLGNSRITSAMFGLYLLAQNAIGNAADNTVNLAVIYPQVREPFAAIYRDYIDGVFDAKPEKVETYGVNGDATFSLEQKIGKQQPNAYITLGNKSTQIAVDLSYKVPIIAAVTNRSLEPHLSAGILLKPSAEVYMDNLFEMVSDITKVAVVYNPDNDSELIEETKKILAKKSLLVEAYEAKDLRSAAKAYGELLAKVDEKTAIWLLSDKTVLDNSLLSLILNTAWEERLVVFSANPVLVKHGALFAIYPDNKGIGFALGILAKKSQINNKIGLQPLKEVRLAVNDRTRSHLGLELSPNIRDRVDLTLPGN